jgi:hypothetical protein
MATTRHAERSAAAKGLSGGAYPEFAHQESVLHGGVLLLLPSLIQQGLFKAADVYTGIKESYYRVESIVLTLAIMALCRIKNPEQTKQCKPGELGRVIGLDRIPEVRCLRNKIKELSEQNKSLQIGQELFRHWMPKDTDSIYLYVDGHVRIYHGAQAQLPSKFVSRQKLCLSGTTEFWVNDINGSPLMVVTGELTEKLQQVIQDQIIPQVVATGVLPAGSASQPICTVIFDREAYSIPLFTSLLEKQIAIMTYRKNVKDIWEESLFKTIEIQSYNTKETMQICEQETQFNGLRMREIRVLTATGHQTAIITTNPVITTMEVALKMFARWSQENYFKYMIANYDFDKMVSYGVETIDKNKEVVNPLHRIMKYQIKKTKEKMSRLEAQFYPLLEQAIDTPVHEMPALTHKQKKIKENIDAYAEQIQNLKTQAQAIPARIKLKDMPPSSRYNKLKTESKMLMNIIKMICYRAETAVANLAAPYLAKDTDEKRKFIQQIIDSPVDIEPDHQRKTLTIMLYSLSAKRYNTALTALIELINQTETIFPGTDLLLIFKLHSS